MTTKYDYTLAQRKALQDRIRSALAKAGLQKQQLAAFCGVTKATISNWFKKDAKDMAVPTTANLVRISEATRVPYAWLACGEEVPPDAAEGNKPIWDGKSGLPCPMCGRH